MAQPAHHGEAAAGRRVSAAEPGQPPPFRRLVWHSVLELFLTFALLSGVVTIVRWVIGPSPVSRGIPQIHLQLLIVGAAVALLLTGLILSPAGRASGGHMNPAISLAMWRFGVFPRTGLVPYFTAQLSGSLLGVLTAGAVWGRGAARPPTSYAVLQPGHGWSSGQLFATETASMAVIVLIVGICLSTPRLARLLPWVVGILIGGAIALLGTSSGGSVNPAREFGPAIASGHIHFLWVYLLAPMLGATIAAAGLRKIHPPSPVTSHRLWGIPASPHHHSPGTGAKREQARNDHPPTRAGVRLVHLARASEGWTAERSPDQVAVAPPSAATTAPVT